MIKKYAFFAKRSSLTTIAVIVLAFITFNTLLFNSAQAESLNSIAAYVNKDVITQQQLAQAFQMAKMELAATHQPLPSDTELKKKVLDHLIDQSLQVQKAKDAGINVTSKMLNDALNHLASQNHLSRAELKTTIEKQGMSFNDYQKNLEQQILINKLLQQAVGKDINISSQEVAHFIDHYQASNTLYQYHVLDYLIALNEHPSAAEKAQALKQAHDLAQTLRQHAGDDATFKQAKSVVSSDLGVRPLGQFPAQFTTQIQAAAAGSVSAPISAPNGIHVLYIAQKLALPQQAATPTHAEAEQMLYLKKLDEASAEFTKQLRKGAYVKILG